jgi:AraC-like DNA-binding protein
MMPRLTTDGDLPRFDIAPRSYLYRLAPIGVGTAAVESLTGYISRLAAAHAVEPGTLLNHELRLRIPCTKGVWAGRIRENLPSYSFYVTAHTLNGVGTRARAWVSLLQQLTCVERLDLLTVLPWAGAISCVNLLRTSRAWCPPCYGGESSSPQSGYERLLWAFQAVTICPLHRVPLESICPFCARRQYVLASRSRPGYCSQCDRWIGRTSGVTFFGSDLADQIRVAEMVGALLETSPTLPASFGLDPLRENVRTIVRGCGGYRRFHAGVRHPHVRDWIRHADIPRMSSLLKLAHSQNVPLICLLTERIERGHKLDRKFIWKAHYRVAGNVVEAALQAALQQHIPPSLQEIANRLGYRSVDPLRFRFPALCREIAARKRTVVTTTRPHPMKAPVPKGRIEEALIAELSKPDYTDLRTVAASVGLSSARRLYKSFRDLRLAISTKNAAIKRRRQELIMTVLEAAFNEQPVPSVAEVARRLGYATVKPLTSRFRERSMELRTCRRRVTQRESGQRVSERVRQTLTEALGEFPPPSCAEVVRRLRGHRTRIREDFPDLWHALRERYWQHVRQVHRAQRKTFASQVYQAVMELHRRGVYPTVRLVLAAIPEPQFRSWEIVAETIRLVRRELSIKPFESCPDQARQN